ncbi:YhgE/Pip domain-containing protein [Microbacterium sp. SSM24]|uniref:YhgE/Pip domain-containing protein n=1 Tax=Microbacterium sp. SSM24 TaxID=2991714 RepID=UPI0022260DE9|nr:SNG1 family protein [Microbacterium sp. SSM24]MCW3492998.1 SNG1 family protein [Microbacterium sp. SSM24]
MTTQLPTVDRAVAETGDAPSRHPLRSLRTWLMPVALIVGVAAALPAIYLSATSDPSGTVSGLPVGLVVESPAAAGSPAATLADAITSAVDESVALTRMTPQELEVAMHEDRVAGAVVIPADFDASLATLLPGADRVTVPTVRIETNAGDGGLSSGLVISSLTPVLHGVAATVGGELTDTAGPALPAANAALLSAPFHVATAPYEPLPSHSGLGTSAFYFALALVLIAFIGASLIGPIVDGALGFIPAELGPLVARSRYTHVSRRRTFVVKAGILTAAAPPAALVVQLVAAGSGVAVDAPFSLWLFATAAIAAIGTSALAVFALLGPGIGALVNTLFFVALAMVSSGGIVPLEATPPFFRAVSAFAPFRFVIDGTRSLFYFDGAPAAGLGGAWIGIIVIGAIGIAGGLVATTAYDRVRTFSRAPRPQL